MAQVVTVDDLINDIRSMLDELNTLSIDDTRDILPALNRAQNYAASILAQDYEEPLLTMTEFSPTAGQSYYDIPEDAYESRIEKLEIVTTPNSAYQVKRVSFRDAHLYETTTTSAIPDAYMVQGNRYKLLPASNGTHTIRLWYPQQPMKMVKQQGRITSINTGTNSLFVDSIGSDITTETDNLNSYVHIIDAQTGDRKGTFQVKTISGNKITFKSTPTRSTVLNYTIDTDLASPTITTETIAEDDYISVVHGSCVPSLQRPFTNFFIQFAVAECTRKLGGNAETEEIILQKLEKQIKLLGTGQEATSRIKRTNKNWSTGYNGRSVRNRWVI